MRFRNSPLSLLDGQDGRGGPAVVVVVSMLETPSMGQEGSVQYSHLLSLLFIKIIIIIIIILPAAPRQRLSAPRAVGVVVEGGARGVGVVQPGDQVQYIGNKFK